MRNAYAPREPLAQELRYVARIQRRSETQDSFGTPLNSWTTYATVRASLKPTDGKEFEASAATQALTNVLITIRGGVTIRAKDRIVVDNTAFEIRAIVNAGWRGRWLYLTCDEQVEPAIPDDAQTSDVLALGEDTGEFLALGEDTSEVLATGD